MAPAKLPIDESVKIPAAVKAAAARADEAQKAYVEGGAPPPKPENTPDEPQPEAKTEEPAPDARKPEVKAEEQKPEAKAEEQKPEAKAEEQKSDDKDIDWENRYRSMEGRFKRADSMNKDLSAQIQSLRKLLATMKQEPKDDPAPPASSITPEEENEYGADFLGVVAKKAKDVVTPEVATLRRQVEQLQQRLEGVQETTTAATRQQLFAKLDSEIENWREINVDDNFMAWLQLPDAFSGAIRHELLKDAYDKNDADRVLRFFRGFLADEAATDPATQSSPSREITPAPNKLEKFAAPGRAKTAATGEVPAEKPIITRAQIAKFYADVNSGVYRGNDEEKNRYERMIFDAENDGRIR